MRGIDAGLEFELVEDVPLQFQVADHVRPPLVREVGILDLAGGPGIDPNQQQLIPHAACLMLIHINVGYPRAL
jgi:hypothetical protein